MAEAADFKPAGRIAPQAWMTEGLAPRVIAALAAAGFTARFVGGCVRDALAGHAIGDLDLASDAPPDRATAILRQAGFRVAPTGLSHGTVTAIAPLDEDDSRDGGPETVELTTLRADLETDGRRAVVAFTGDWHGDATRRDFTFNALYLDPDGTLYDPFGGIADLEAGRVRFIGAAAERLAEDRLRWLRFFRFRARFGTDPIDAETDAALRAAAPALPSLAAERVRVETLRLLVGLDPVPVWREMIAAGGVAALYPSLVEVERLAALIAVETALDRPDALRRLAALNRAEPAEKLARMLRLSNRERDRLIAMRWQAEPAAAAPEAASIDGLLYLAGRAAAVDRLILGGTAGEAPLAALAEAVALAETRAVPVLPVKGADVLAQGAEPGARIGQVLEAVESWWRENAFQPDRDACLAKIAALLAP